MQDIPKQVTFRYGPKHPCVLMFYSNEIIHPTDGLEDNNDGADSILGLGWEEFFVQS